MEYLDVRSKIPYVSEPARTVIEIDDARKETRELQFYPSGLVTFAWSGGATRPCKLHERPMPTIAEIDEILELHIVLRDVAEFEALWAAHGPAAPGS